MSVARKKNSMNVTSYPIVFLNVLQDHSPEKGATHIVWVYPSDLSIFRLINLSIQLIYLHNYLQVCPGSHISSYLDLI